MFSWSGVLISIKLTGRRAMRMKCYMTTTHKARIKGESILSLHIISNTLPRRLTQESTFKKVQLRENLKNSFIFCVDTVES